MRRSRGYSETTDTHISCRKEIEALHQERNNLYHTLHNVAKVLREDKNGVWSAAQILRADLTNEGLIIWVR